MLACASGPGHTPVALTEVGLAGIVEAFVVRVLEMKRVNALMWSREMMQMPGPACSA